MAEASWSRLPNGKWEIPTFAQSDDDDPIPSLPDYESYCKFDSFHGSIHFVDDPVTPTPLVTPTATQSLFQCNTGANALCTNDISLLHDVQWITPIQCDTAKEGASLIIEAVGTMFATADAITLPISVYYSRDAPMTIISPNAVLQ